ncbi:FixH family protein [Flaviaesturariibacter terrae]
MRISWGHKIAAVYILFVAGILTLVAKASSQHFDLVTEDYYEQELRFQNVINEQKAVSALSEAPRYVATQGTVQLLLPAEFEGKAWKGDLYLYRPSDAKLDIRKEVDGNGRAYVFVLPKALQGNYTLKFSWELDGKKYYDEKTITF